MRQVIARCVTIVTLAAVATLSSGPSLEAQTPRLGVDRAALSGVMLDSATQKPPRKILICPYARSGEKWLTSMCAIPDSAGRYRLDDLLLTTVLVHVTCETVRGFGKNVALDTIEITEPKEIRKDWRLSMAGCDLRPMRQVKGTFTGFWTPGFEISEFLPCAVDAWYLQSDSLPLTERDQQAWAVLGKGVRIGKRPEAPRDRWGNSQYYVEWRGTLEGPGHYGHFGLSSFLFRADSIMQLRARQPGDCGRDAQ